MRCWLFCGLIVPVLSGCVGPTPRDALKDEIRAVLQEDPELIVEALKGHEVELVSLVNRGVQFRDVTAKQDQRLAELRQPYQPVTRHASRSRPSFSSRHHR